MSLSIKQLKAAKQAAVQLTDSSVPVEHRKALLGQICLDESPEHLFIINEILSAAGKTNSEDLYAKKAKELSEQLEELASGPLRPATFIGKVEPAGTSVRRAQVLMQNGDSAYPVVTDMELYEELRCGDMVLIDAQARAVLCREPATPFVGEEAKLERTIDDDRVEAVLRDHEPFVFRVAQNLRDKMEAGEVPPGSKLLVCSRRAMAFDAVPLPEGVSHYRYLCREPVPDVVVARDIGSPPSFIKELTEHLRAELDSPELGRKYKLRRAKSKLLTGVSGSGKSLSIRGLWRNMYELMSERTGVKIEDLPPRVIRLRMPQVLSKWLGDSDKNLDRFFDEVEQLAEEKFVTPDGVEMELPLLVICEEIDGLARSRGSSDAVYDRIQTTALERLDMNCQRLSDKLVTFVFTTNIPHLVDSAFLRRAGGTVENFGRLNRRGFAAVLDKHLDGLPLQLQFDRRNLLREATDWLFAAGGQDPGQVEMTYVNSGEPVVKHRRDFLTGALVDRAVQQAATEACRLEREGTEEPGVGPELLIAAFTDQIAAIVNQLTQHNAENYLTLPDGARVASLRRITQPSLQPHQLYRSAT